MCALNERVHGFVVCVSHSMHIDRLCMYIFHIFLFCLYCKYYIRFDSIWWIRNKQQQQTYNAFFFPFDDDLLLLTNIHTKHENETDKREKEEGRKKNETFLEWNTTISIPLLSEFQLKQKKKEKIYSYKPNKSQLNEKKISNKRRRNRRRRASETKKNKELKEKDHQHIGHLLG